MAKAGHSARSLHQLKLVAKKTTTIASTHAAGRTSVSAWYSREDGDLGSQQRGLFASCRRCAVKQQARAASPLIMTSLAGNHRNLTAGAGVEQFQLASIVSQWSPNETLGSGRSAHHLLPEKEFGARGQNPSSGPRRIDVSLQFRVFSRGKLVYGNVRDDPIQRHQSFINTGQNATCPISSVLWPTW